VLDARQSTFGWDHHAGSPLGVFDKAPLNVLVNVDGTPGNGEADFCGGALAKYNACILDGANMQSPYPDDWTGCAYMCTSNVGALVHEIGHHVDQHLTYGIMGSSVATGTCVPGTTDEAIPLRETIGDIVTLWSIKKMYPTLPYTFSTTSSPCSFNSIGRGTFAPHDPSCLSQNSQLGWFDGPSASNSHECNYSYGYRLMPVVEGVWAWLFRQFCDVEYPFSCVTTFGGSVNEFMNGVMYALGLSNAQSYETFFENIETHLWVSMGQSEADNFRFMMSKYGLLDP
jgi:hypothetical protein